MSVGGRTRRLELEAAQRRAREQIGRTAEETATSRRLAVLGTAVVLFGAIFASRLAVNDPSALIANFYVIPVVLFAVELGTTAGVAAAIAALGLVFAWDLIERVHLGALGYTSRGAVLLVTGAVVGRFSERLRKHIAGRRQAQRQLSLYADQLEQAIESLGRTVDQLEAFAEIARAVGGETDLERILGLILSHGKEIVGARTLLALLPEGEELLAVSAGQLGEPPRTLRTAGGSVVDEVLSSRRALRLTGASDPQRLRQLDSTANAAILVPLIFQGQALGVLAGIDRLAAGSFTEEDEQLLMSIAASAATALTTARSVAAERLRVSIEAAEQSRARWARELHDQTLQGLTGVRLVVSAALSTGKEETLRRAASKADEHLAAEMRNLRELIAELRPASLDDLGLGPAIESLASKQAAVAGFSVDLGIDLGDNVRPPEAENAIYRIVQEALSNVVKHAGAGGVTVRVRQFDGRVEVAVEDDGCGFEPQSSGEGFGLKGMRERAVLLGGRLSIDSRQGGPTRIRAVVPLAGQQQAQSTSTT